MRKEFQGVASRVLIYRLLPRTLLILVAACGASSERRPATHRDFDAIQRQETALETREVEFTRVMASEPPNLEDANNAAMGVCDSANRICEIAGELTDEDAMLRCSRARDRCSAMQAQLARGDL